MELIWTLVPKHFCMFLKIQACVVISCKSATTFTTSKFISGQFVTYYTKNLITAQKAGNWYLFCSE